MNFKNIFEMQKELDQAIMLAHNISSNESIFKKRVVALIVELGEFANEYAPFKYWKKNKVVDRAKLLEEFVDGIHFFSSMAIEEKLPEEIIPLVVCDDQAEQLLETFNAVANLKDKYDAEQILKCFQLYMGLAKQLGITDKEVEDFYINKNRINYDRIAKNY